MAQGFKRICSEPQTGLNHYVGGTDKATPAQRCFEYYMYL